MNEDQKYMWKTHTVIFFSFTCNPLPPLMASRGQELWKVQQPNSHPSFSVFHFQDFRSLRRNKCEEFHKKYWKNGEYKLDSSVGPDPHFAASQLILWWTMNPCTDLKYAQNIKHVCLHVTNKIGNYTNENLWKKYISRLYKQLQNIMTTSSHIFLILWKPVSSCWAVWFMLTGLEVGWHISMHLKNASFSLPLILLIYLLISVIIVPIFMTALSLLSPSNS